MAQQPKSIRDYYNMAASQWADRWYPDNTNLPLLETFLALLPRQPQVLDLCCGAGYESMRLAQLGACVTGLDFSEKSIAIAREHNPALTFHVDNMLNDYSYIGAMDGIVCIAGLVHLPPEQLTPAFRRMAQTLKCGGHILLVVRHGSGRRDDISDVEIDGVCYNRDFYAYTLEELCHAAAGLFTFVKEVPEPDASFWRNYIFRKVD